MDGLQCQYMGEDTYSQSSDVQGCVVKSLHQLADLCGKMPPLPDERYLVGVIRYMDDDWEPEGFTRTHRSEATVSEFKSRHMDTKDLGVSSSGFHE